MVSDHKKCIKVNKYVKGCLFFLGIAVIIILMLVGWIYYGMVTSNERQNQDDKDCENIVFITDNPLIVIENATASYNADINLILMDKNDTIEKKVIRNMAYNKIEFNIPFKKFKKTDKILIVTKNKNYIISQMGYFNDGHWGMFGYLGGKCEFFYNSELAKK